LNDFFSGLPCGYAKNLFDAINFHQPYPTDIYLYAGGAESGKYGGVNVEVKANSLKKGIKEDAEVNN